MILYLISKTVPKCKISTIYKYFHIFFFDNKTGGGGGWGVGLFNSSFNAIFKNAYFM